MKITSKELILRYSDSKSRWRSLVRLTLDPNSNQVHLAVRCDGSFGKALHMNRVDNAGDWHEAIREGTRQVKEHIPEAVLLRDSLKQTWQETLADNTTVVMSLTQGCIRQNPGQPHQSISATAPSWEAAIEAARDTIKVLTTAYPTTSAPPKIRLLS